ncbi:hypothetical protein AB3M80_16365 [Arthrospira platensis BEA 1257B]
MVTSTLTNYSLSERQWQIAHKIAIDLVINGADVNELGKALFYLRAIQQEPDAGKRFLTYLETLVKQGNRIGYSKTTPQYFAMIESVCKQHLKGDIENSVTMLKILGWSFRLMRYYKNGGVPPETLRTIRDKIKIPDPDESDTQKKRKK